jgi:hypothetical protein
VHRPSRYFYRRRRPGSVECTQMRSDRSDLALARPSEPRLLPQRVASWPTERPWPRSSEDSSSVLREQYRLASGLTGRAAQQAGLPGGRDRPGAAAQQAGLAQCQSAQPSERGSLAWSASWRARPRNNSWPAAFFLFFLFFFSFCLFISSLSRWTIKLVH